MSHFVQITESLIDSEAVTTSTTATFETRKGTTGAGIQLSMSSCDACITGTVTYSISIDGTNFVAAPCVTGVTFPAAFGTTNATVDRIDVFTDTNYNFIKLDITCVTCGTYTVSADAIRKG